LRFVYDEGLVDWFLLPLLFLALAGDFHIKREHIACVNALVGLQSVNVGVKLGFESLIHTPCPFSE